MFKYAGIERKKILPTERG